MCFFDANLSILENAYYLSGPLLVVIGAIALKQLSIAREDIRVRSRREAATLAATLSKEFALEIVPKLDAFSDACKDDGIPEYTGPIGDFSIPADNTPAHKWIKEWATKNKKTGPCALALMNHLEAHAVYFTSKVADEEVGFSTEGHLFCRAVKRLYPFLARLQFAPNHHNHRPVIDLFKVWNGRFECENLAAEADKLARETLAVAEKLKKSNSPPLRPIGT